MKKLINFFKQEKIVLAAIIILGFAVRLYKINSPIADWHSFRQADTAAVARMYLQNGINLFVPRYYDVSRVQSGFFNPMGYRFVEFPIYALLHVFAYRILPFITFETVGRLLSVIFSLITAFFIYKIARVIFSKNIAVLSAFFYLMLPYNIYFTRVILPEPLSVMLGVIALWFFVGFVKDGSKRKLILYSIFMSLAILVKPYLILYNLYPVFYFWKKHGIKRILINKEVVLMSLIIFVPFLLWRWWIQEHPEGIPFWKWTLNGDGVRFKPAFWYWIFGERIGKLILGVWGIFPLCMGLIHGRKNSFLISLVLGNILYLSVIATANVRHDYYQTLIIPAISLLLAIGFDQVYTDYKNIKFGFVIPLSILFLMLVISAFQVKEYYKIDHPEIMDAGRAVDRLAPEDALVIASYNGDTAFLYQTNRKGWPVVELPINELIDEGASYYASVNLNDSQTIEFMNKFQILEKTNTYVVLKLK